MMKFFENHLLSLIGIFCFSYLWIVLGCLLGLDQIVNIVKHPILFWECFIIWFLVFLVLLSYYDFCVYSYLLYQHLEENILQSSWISWMGFFFIKRVIHLFLMFVPLIFFVFFLVPVFFFLLSYFKGYSMESFFLVFSNWNIQVTITMLLVLGYFFFDIKFSFVDYFLNLQKENTILSAYFSSFKFCHFRIVYSILLKNWYWYSLQLIWVLIVLLIPFKQEAFWIFMGLSILFYLAFYPIKKRREILFFKRIDRENVL